MGSASGKKKTKTAATTVAATQAFKTKSDKKKSGDDLPPKQQSQTSSPGKARKIPTSSGKILISFHSKDYDKAQELRSCLQQNEFEVFLISEGSPAALQLREQSVQWCDVFVLIATFNYQRSPYCVELTNYAKDKKKPVVSLIAQPNFSPSGSIGALSLAWAANVNHVQTTQENNNKFLAAVKDKMSGSQPSEVAMPTHDTDEGSGVQTEKTPGSYVCIVFHEDGTNVAQMLRGGTGVSNKGAQANTLSSLPIKMGNPLVSNLDMIKACKVFIPVLTSGFQVTPKCQEEYEFARKCEKFIVPVKGQKFWPSGWLSLGIAGKLYYELTDTTQAYTHHTNVPDSNPMNDFIFAVMSAMQGEQSEEEREQADIAALTKQIEAIKPKLDEWPPKAREQTEQREPPPHPDKLVTQDKENLPFNYIKYQVTRMTFKPPEPLFDNHGRPIEQKFDIMLSYQWDIQNFVRDMYMELDMKTFRTWMDVWGGMQGNINEAMATAVENSTLMFSFLTARYQQSINCNLELQYAKQKQIPIIFIKVEPDLKLTDWIQELTDKSLVYTMRSISDFGVMENGIPKINRLAEAARNLIKWAATQPKQLRTDVSEEVYRLQNLLEDALCAQAEKENRKRYLTCTRCGAQFEADGDSGCKKHGAYYMGGSILAGRWVCCQQRGKDGMGCENTNHITTARKWSEIQGGCHKWIPE